MDPIYIGKAMWSPSWSQCLTGYNKKGEFVTTPRVYATCRENEYTTSEGQTVYVTSWAPDGRGYKDEKDKK